MSQALKAIFESDTGSLGALLDSECLGVDSADDEGNTLLHYAVACQRNDVVKLLCERLFKAMSVFACVRGSAAHAKLCDICMYACMDE